MRSPAVELLEGLCEKGYLSGEWVYFLADYGQGTVKIGSTTGLSKRIGQLQTGNARDLVFLGAVSVAKGTGRAFEESVHRLFADNRVRGEWFDLDQGIIAFIDACAVGGDSGWRERHRDRIVKSSLSNIFGNMLAGTTVSI